MVLSLLVLAALAGLVLLVLFVLFRAAGGLVSAAVGVALVLGVLAFVLLDPVGLFSSIPALGEWSDALRDALREFGI